MPHSIFLRTAAALCAAGMAACALAADVLPALPASRFHDYLLSPQFGALMRGHLMASAPGCAEPARWQLLALRTSQRVQMEDAVAHPVDGLWTLRAEVQACGVLAERELSFAAQAGDVPRLLSSR